MNSYPLATIIDPDAIRASLVSVDFRQLHPAVYAGATAAFVFVLLLILYRTVIRRRHLKNDQVMSAMVDRFIDERNKSEVILADLDVGVIAYNSDGMMLNANPAAQKLLQPHAVAETLDQFVSRYGQENGIQAAVLLGKMHISGQFVHQDHILRIRLKESRFEEGRTAGTIVILQDITEQEREERQRKEFVANVSHELKTPLTTIKTYTESLLDWGLEEKNSEAIRKDVWRIHDDSLRMERLVEDLLLLSSLDSRGFRFRPELVDLAQLIRQVTDRLQIQAQEKNIALSSIALSHIPLVLVDRAALDRVLTNLIGNAIKYTDKSGRVQVFVSYLLNDVFVKIADSGFGIDQDHLPHVFDRFYRVDLTGSRMYGGTGLGLSIAKELVELHNGTIGVSSTLGKGTEFTFMVPIARKVFRDAVHARPLASSHPNALLRTAYEELSAFARENDLADQTAASWTPEQINDIIDCLLKQDESMVSGDTKAYQVVDAALIHTGQEAVVPDQEESPPAPGREP